MNQGNGANNPVTYYVKILANNTELWLWSHQMFKPGLKYNSLNKLEELYV